MANWNTLKTAVADIINANGNQEITGQILQNALNNIITNVGENATFAGIATLDTNPGAPDGPVFYLTATAGTYPNFNGIEVQNGEAVILLWNNNAWSKKVAGFATQQNVSNLDSKISVINTKTIIEVNWEKGYYKSDGTIAEPSALYDYRYASIQLTSPFDNTLYLKIRCTSSAYVLVMKGSEILSSHQLDGSGVLKIRIPFYATEVRVSNSFTHIDTPSISSSNEMAFETFYDCLLWHNESYYKADGTIKELPETNYKTSKPIYIKGVNEFTTNVRSGGQGYNLFLDANYRIISGFQQNDGITQTIQVPSEAYYVVLTNNFIGETQSPIIEIDDERIRLLDAPIEQLSISSEQHELRLSSIENEIYNPKEAITSKTFETASMSPGSAEYIYSNDEYVEYDCVISAIRMKASVIGGTIKLYKVDESNNLTYLFDVQSTDSEIHTNIQLKKGERIAYANAEKYIYYQSGISGASWSTWNKGTFVYDHRTQGYNFAIRFYSNSSVLKELDNKEIIIKNKLYTIFDKEFINKSLYTGIDENQISEEGYSPLLGFDKKVKINRLTTSDEYKLFYEITLSNKNSIFALSSIGNLTLRCSLVSFNFKDGTINFHESSTGGDEYTDIIATKSIDSLEGDRFILEVGRKNRNIYAAVTNYTTAVRTEFMPNETNKMGRTYGWFYDYPAFSLIEGSIIIHKVYETLPQNPFMVFLGDSITQGYGVDYDKCWAKICCDYFGGGSFISARSGGTYVHMLQKLKQELPTINPKYVVVTIGTNGGSNIENMNEIRALIEDMGATPIINCIYQKPSNSAGMDLTARKALNNIILSLDVLTSRFDIATSNGYDINAGGNAEYFQSDNVHLSELGNKVVAERFITDMQLIYPNK